MRWKPTHSDPRSSTTTTCTFASCQLPTFLLASLLRPRLLLQGGRPRAAGARQRLVVLQQPRLLCDVDATQLLLARRCLHAAAADASCTARAAARGGARDAVVSFVLLGGIEIDKEPGGRGAQRARAPPAWRTLRPAALLLCAIAGGQITRTAPTTRRTGMAKSRASRGRPWPLLTFILTTPSIALSGPVQISDTQRGLDGQGPPESAPLRLAMQLAPVLLRVRAKNDLFAHKKTCPARSPVRNPPAWREARELILGGPSQAGLSGEGASLLKRPKLLGTPRVNSAASRFEHCTGSRQNPGQDWAFHSKKAVPASDPGEHLCNLHGSTRWS